MFMKQTTGPKISETFKRLMLLACLLFCCGAAAWAQKTVTGTVTDSFGEPVIGANVIVKGTTRGVTTNIDGQYSITNVSEKDILRFSFIGCTTQELPAAGKSVIDVKLEEENDLLDEVVVVGYGVQKRRDLTGSIVSVKAEDITVAPVANAMEGLQGKIAGLDITRESGEAGASPAMLLRGARSLSGNNDPLFVIDGIQGGSIDDLNPNDIESIEVLKDASSTAVYGSRGANGVIIITTKKGKEGKAQVDFNAYLGVNCLPAYPETYTGQDWVNYLADGYKAYYGTSVWDKYSTHEEALNRLFNNFGISQAAIDCYNAGQNINWKDEILQTGLQQNYNVSVRGGTDKSNSYMSLGFQDEKGMYRNDEYKQLTFRGGTDYKINRYITTGFQATLTHKDNNKRNSRLSKTLNEVPVGEVYNADGSLKWYPTGSENDYVNIMADDIPGQYVNKSNSLTVNVAPYLRITPIKGLTFNSTANYRLGYSNSGLYEGLYTYYKLTGSSTDIGIRTASKSNSKSDNFTWQNYVTYNLAINKAHDVTVMAGIEWSKSKSESTTAANRGFDFDSFTYNNLVAGDQPSVSSGYTQTQMLSYIFRVNYTLMGRYLFQASGRYDGASQLYDKWDFFPSFSAGWRISDEAFMEDAKEYVDNLKLRASYGCTGNYTVDAYSSMSLIESLGTNLNLGSGAAMEYILKQKVGTHDLKWETCKSTNIGLDFAGLNSRIDGSLEWYNTRTEDVLYYRELPFSYGSYNAKKPYQLTSNIAEIENHGFEATVNIRPFMHKDFMWTSTFTYAYNKEAIKKIDLGSGTSVDELISLGLFINNPVSTYYGYKKVGIWQSDEADKAACFGLQPGQVHLAASKDLKWDPDYEYVGYSQDRETSAYTAVNRHGAYYIEDADGNRTYYRQGSPKYDENGKITGYDDQQNLYSVSASDKRILGHKQPDFTLGWTNTFEYKGFDLSILTVMRWGQMCQGDLLGYVSSKNQPKCFDYWTPTNATNAFPLAALGVSNEAKEALTYVDGSFVKIKTISLGYRLPRKVLKDLHMTNLRVYGTVQNPFIFAHDDMLKGLDPENTSSSFPLYKTFVFGINASF